MENQNEKSIFNLGIDDEANYNLLELAKWARFLGIIGYVFLGLMVVASFIFMFAFSELSSGVMTATAIILVYLVIAGLYFYPVYALYKSGKEIKSGLLSSDQIEFNRGLQYLKNCFKYMGILTIVILSFYAIALIIGLISSAL